MSLAAVRAALDAAPSEDTATLARRTRNALAQAVLAEAFTHEPPTPAEHGCRRSPRSAEHLGPELAAELAAVYAGGPDWTTHAIDALEPLHALTRS